MSENAQPASKSRPWMERTGFMLFLSWVLLVIAQMWLSLCRVSLASTTTEWLIGSLMAGLFLGTITFLLPVGPSSLLILSLASWLKWSRRITARLLLLPALIVAGYNFWEGVKWPAWEPQRLVLITNLEWPHQARCLMARHGWGLQDKRHLWVFEGTPEEFARHRAQLPWDRSEEEEEYFAKNAPKTRYPIKEIQRAFGANAPWYPDEIYMWMHEREAETGPFGPGWLLVNADHTRWCIWWDGI